jgi:hypothetical protein
MTEPGTTLVGSRQSSGRVTRTRPAAAAPDSWRRIVAKGSSDHDCYVVELAENC